MFADDVDPAGGFNDKFLQELPFILSLFFARPKKSEKRKDALSEEFLSAKASKTGLETPPLVAMPLACGIRSFLGHILQIRKIANYRSTSIQIYS